MISEFVKAWDQDKNKIKDFFEKFHPENHLDIVKQVVKMLSKSNLTGSKDDEKPNPDRIHTVVEHYYRGTMVYVIGGFGRERDKFWYVKVDYGCYDTLESINNNDTYGKPNKEQVDQYMAMALHIIQGLRLMCD